MSSGQNKRVSSIAKKLGQMIKRKKMRIYSLADWVIVLVCLFVYVLTLEYAKTGYFLKDGGSRTVEIDREVVSQLRDGKDAAINSHNINELGRTRLGRAAVKAGTALDYYLSNVDEIDRLVTYTKVEYVSGLDLSNYEVLWSNDTYSAVVTFKLPLMLELLCALFAVICLKIVQRLWCLITSGFEKRRITHILRPIDEIAAKADELTRLEFDETKYHNLEERIAGLDPEDSLPVTQGDGELESLENAINNLLMRMRESNRQQARFVNDASHELRTPIAVIEGYANMLARWGREDEKVLDESIQAIQHESSHMKYLVEQLLFLARGDSGKTVLKPEDISLTDMMREIYEESLMIDENHVYRFSSTEGEDIHLTCDPALIKQAVRILVDNAAKYTKEKDEIQLGVGVDESGHPYLQVEDTGIGMAESDVAHMFERFYRSDEVRSFKGTGLGLSIAKWIVDKHNGHFEVTSREGIGTRIRVVL